MFKLQSVLFPDADVMNLISVDIANLQKGFRFAHFPWSCPIQIGVSVFCLFTILDKAVFPGKFFSPLEIDL